MINVIKAWLDIAAVQIETKAILWLSRITAATLIIPGIITFPLPIPIGLILIITGTAMLISSSHQLAKFIRQYHSKNSKFKMRLEKN